jgi:oligosaccharide repeat unit polymerase
MGMYKDINILKYSLGWGLFLLIVFCVQRLYKNRVTLYIAKLYLVFIILPQISLWGIKNFSVKSIVAMLIYWIIFLLALKLFCSFDISKETSKKNKKVNLNIRLSSRITVILLLVISSLVIIYISWKYTGFRFTLSFENVYEFREGYSAKASSPILGYLLPLAASVALPYCFIVYLIEKKYKISILIMLIGVLSFSISGMKTWLFIYLAILFFMYFGNRIKLGIMNYFLIFLILFTGISAGTYYINNNINLVSIHNRILSYPAELNFYYFYFFSNNELLFLRESILRYFFESPYDINSPYLISYTYGSGDGLNNAVNGLFGDAFANFGYLGVLVYPILLAFAMYILMYLLKSYPDYRYAYSIIFIVVWNSINTSFFTWLLTGGVLLFYLILFINKGKTGLSLKVL